MLLVALTMLLLLSSAVGSPARAGCERVQDRQVPVPAGVVVPDASVRVVLPASYCTGHRAYPVLYLLHGVGDTWQSWTAHTDLIDLVADAEVIVVMPDGGRGADAGWYSDWSTPDGPDWETFHIGHLVPWVDATYRTLADGQHRAVAGLSMGGFGALSYAARHPGTFAAAASFSGFVDTMREWPLSGYAYDAASEQLGSPSAEVWGDPVQNEAEWRRHNPADLADQLVGTEVLLTSGTGTPGGAHGEVSDPSKAGLYAIEHYLFQLNVGLVPRLELHGVEHTEDLYVGGYHGWPYWEASLRWALPQILAVIGPSAPPGRGSR